MKRPSSFENCPNMQNIKGNFKPLFYLIISRVAFSEVDRSLGMIRKDPVHVQVDQQVLQLFLWIPIVVEDVRQAVVSQRVDVNEHCSIVDLRSLNWSLLATAWSQLHLVNDTFVPFRLSISSFFDHNSLAKADSRRSQGLHLVESVLRGQISVAQQKHVGKLYDMTNKHTVNYLITSVCKSWKALIDDFSKACRKTRSLPTPRSSNFLTKRDSAVSE